MTSLRDATGDKDPALIFSFCGLAVSDLVTISAGTALGETTERLAGNEARVVEAVLLRKLGVLSKLESPFRDGQELRRALPIGLLNIGPLKGG